jgi:FKBP-type peptidyl-prolyl cis-trans isomerase
MKSSKLIILTASLFLILASACESISTTNIKWQTDNEAYFTNMKDSAAYTLVTIPALQGGGSYYYKITIPGNQTSGSPLANDTVTVNYRGQMIDGTIFDQTYIGANPLASTNFPTKFVANQLIYGWTLNLMQMKAGEIRTIILPQELAYGASGIGGAIPPYSTLRFDIQLISFSKH